MPDLILIAASGLAREVLALVRYSGSFNIRGILDDDLDLLGQRIDGTHVLGSIEDVAQFPSEELVVCVGAGRSRQRVVDRLELLGVGQHRFARVMAPGTYIPDGCLVGNGSILMPSVVLTANVSLGRHVVAMPGVTFTHEDIVEDFATVAAGVTLGGGVRIGKAAYLGMNSAVRQNLEVGAGATLGMGAVLTSCLPAGETWVGNPARPLRRPGAEHAHWGGLR